MTGSFDIVEQHWPFDGPHDTDTILTAAGALPGLVRYLNNATGPGGHRLQDAQDVDRIVGSLHNTVGLLPPLLTQMREFISRQAKQGVLYDDRARHDSGLATATAVELVSALMVVEDSVNAVYSALGFVRRCSNHLGNRDGGDQ